MSGEESLKAARAKLEEAIGEIRDALDDIGGVADQPDLHGVVTNYVLIFAETYWPNDGTGLGSTHVQTIGPLDAPRWQSLGLTRQSIVEQEHELVCHGRSE